MEVEVTAHASQLQTELADFFSQLLSDAKPPQDIIAEVAALCEARAELLRNEAISHIHRPARHMHLISLAEEMEAQAATWQLVFCLYCDEAAPAGQGGRDVQDAGDVRTHRQRAADQVLAEPDLTRCARVVSWLESLAETGLRRGAGGAEVVFSEGEALWRESRAMAAARPGSQAELDPDAPSRKGTVLHPDNAKSQERLMARLWQLLRAGQVRDARKLCALAGQAWRAVSLSGGGEWGPLPVGVAAAEMDELLTEAQQAEEMAAEVDSGAGTMRGLWKWAVRRASEQSDSGLVMSGAGRRYEPAVYGALCGNVAAMAPVCSTWEDRCWAYCRAWLDMRTDKALPLEPLPQQDMVAGGAVVAALARCGVPQEACEHAMQGAVSAVTGSGWPPSMERVTDTALTATSFGQLFATLQDMLAMTALAGQGGVGQLLRRVQCLLIQDAMYGLASHLHSWLVERTGPGMAIESAQGDDDDGMMMMMGGYGGAASLRATGSTAAEDAASGDRSWRSATFGAHLLLALEALGVLQGSTSTSAGGQGQGQVQAITDDMFDAVKTADLCQRLVVFYCGRLLERGQLGLVPPYLCCLRPSLRGALTQELLALHSRRTTGQASSPSSSSRGHEASAAAELVGMDEGQGDDGDMIADEADSECYGAYRVLAQWFGHCSQRQAMSEGQVLSNYLGTDIRPDEMRVQLRAFVEAARASRVYGPRQRTRIARWLYYPWLAAQQDMAEAAAAQAEVAAGEGDPAAAVIAATEASASSARADPLSLLDALEFTNTLLTELALGDAVTAAAGQELVAEVIPQGFEAAVIEAVDSLRSHAAAGGSSQEGYDDDGSDEGAGGPAGGVDVEALQVAAMLEERLAELMQWRAYLDIDARTSAWARQHDALQAVAAGSGGALLLGALSVADVRRAGAELLMDCQDQLLLSSWMQGLCETPRALVACVDGRCEVRLGLTCPAHSEAAPPSASSWGSPTSPYPELKGAALYEAETQLRAALAKATSGASSSSSMGLLSVHVDRPADAQGHIGVTITCPATPQAWDAAVHLATSVVQATLPDLPPLLLVTLDTNRPTALAIARRCCLAHAVVRCASVRLALASLGGRHDEQQQQHEADALGSSLLELLAAPAPHGLAPLLPTSLLQQVLKLEADTQVQLLYKKQLARQSS